MKIHAPIWMSTSFVVPVVSREIYSPAGMPPRRVRRRMPTSRTFPSDAEPSEWSLQAGQRVECAGWGSFEGFQEGAE